MIFHIICGKYYNNKTKEYYVGGVETYIQNLVSVISNQNNYIYIYQRGSKDQLIEMNEFLSVVTCRVKKDKELIKYASKNADYDKDVLIFATSIDICSNRFKKTIAIQHGIYWDVPSIHGISNIKENLSTYLKVPRTIASHP